MLAGSPANLAQEPRGRPPFVKPRVQISSSESEIEDLKAQTSNPLESSGRVLSVTAGTAGGDVCGVLRSRVGEISSRGRFGGRGRAFRALAWSLPGVSAKGRAASAGAGRPARARTRRAPSSLRRRAMRLSGRSYAFTVRT